MNAERLVEQLLKATNGNTELCRQLIKIMATEAMSKIGAWQTSCELVLDRHDYGK